MSKMSDNVSAGAHKAAQTVGLESKPAGQQIKEVRTVMAGGLC